jgi:hypothetical protein
MPSRKQHRDPRLVALSAVARHQRRFFTLAQALDAGFDRKRVRFELAVGAWHEVAPRVYCAGPTGRLTKVDELAALVLSCDGAAARRSALALYGLMPHPTEHHLLVRRTKRNLARVVVHSSLDLPASEIVTVDGIRATSPVRSVIDGAGDVRREVVNDFVDDAIVRGLVRPTVLARRARELLAPARPGAARVLTSLATSHPELDRARNTWEARMLRASREYELPDPTPNFPVIVNGQLRILDLAWAPPKVFAEFDGYLPHTRSRKVFDDDRVRQNDLVDAGWLVFRVTSTTLQRRPRETFAAIARAIAQRSVAQR